MEKQTIYNANIRNFINILNLLQAKLGYLSFLLLIYERVSFPIHKYVFFKCSKNKNMQDISTEFFREALKFLVTPFFNSKCDALRELFFTDSQNFQG